MHPRFAEPDFDDDVYDDIAPPFPVAYVSDGRSIPDLGAIPRSDWKDVLAWCEPWVRTLAIGTTTSHDDNVAAQWALHELSLDAHARREAALTRSAPPPVAVVSHTVLRRDRRQLNFRVSDEEYEEIDRAARAYGVSAARLARMLTIRGVRRALEGS